MATPGSLTLCLDVGASSIKAQTVGPRGGPRGESLRVESPDPMTPHSLVTALVELAGRLEPFDRISVGLPGIVHRGTVYALPVLGDHRVRGFRLATILERRLRRRTRIMNDAEMHGLGVIRRRGVELVLTLGTGLGTALYLDGELGPRLQFMASPGHPEPIGGAYGDAARKKLGTAAWSRRVRELVRVMRRLTNFDRCYIGGGNARVLRGRWPRGVTRVDNSVAALGGVRLWEWDIAT